MSKDKAQPFTDEKIASIRGLCVSLDSEDPAWADHTVLGLLATIDADRARIAELEALLREAGTYILFDNGSSYEPELKAKLMAKLKVAALSYPHQDSK